MPKARGEVNVNGRKTHCFQGHPFGDRIVGSRQRVCKPCSNAAKRRWDKANPEKTRAAISRWHAANIERFRAVQRVYQADNPDKMRDQVEIRRARIHNALVERVDRTVVFQRDNGICQIGTVCGNTPVNPESWHLDHIISLSRGGEHSYANTQVSCPPCNLRKGTRAA